MNYNTVSNINQLTAKQKKILKNISSKHNRKKHGLILCEGIRACKEALKNFPDKINLIIKKENLDIDTLQEYQIQDTEIITADNTFFNTISKTESPQDIIIILQEPEKKTLSHETHSSLPLILILDRVQDPGNAGTILRTAWAAGIKAAIATKGTVDLFSPKTIRAGMGAQFKIDLFYTENLQDTQDQIKQLGFKFLWESIPQNGINCYSEDFQLEKTAIVIGNEANGSALLKDSKKVTIPMPGDAESLNAAQAATILIFEAVRRGILT